MKANLRRFLFCSKARAFSAPVGNSFKSSVLTSAIGMRWGMRRGILGSLSSESFGNLLGTSLATDLNGFLTVLAASKLPQETRKRQLVRVRLVSVIRLTALAMLEFGLVESLIGRKASTSQCGCTRKDCDIHVTAVFI